MRRISILLLAGFLLLTATASGGSKRIVGGGDVPAGEYGFVANIEINGAFGCTGTLIAPTWVMTAGHCSSATGVGAASPAPNPGEAYTITLGTVNADGTGGTKHFVKTDGVHVPSSYSAQNGSGSDVGLLELTAPVTGIAPMTIAAADERSIWEPGDMVTAAGFGVTKAGGDAPDVMQRVDLPIVTDTACGAAYSDPTPILGDAFDPTTEVCAGYREGGKDSCQGDSGGPLLAHAGTELRLVGATSRGQGCAEPGFPGIYARVAEGSMRAFVAGLVPGAFAPEGVSEGPNTTGDPGAGGFPEPQPPVATPTPTPAPRSCEGRSGMSFRVRSLGGGALRKVRVRLNGKTLANRRGKLKPFTVKLAKRLPSSGTTKLRVFTRTAKGVRRVTVRTYTDCTATGTRTRRLRMV